MEVDGKKEEVGKDCKRETQCRSNNQMSSSPHYQRLQSPLIHYYVVDDELHYKWINILAGKKRHNY